RGLTYRKKRQYDKALADFTITVQISPRFAQAFIDRGNIYLDKGDYGNAIVDYTKSLHINPRNANLYNNRGLAYWFRGHYEAAIADYTKAIELSPKSARAHHNRGIAYFDKGEYTAAMADFDRAIELDTDYIDDAYDSKGRVLVRMGNFPIALDYHNRAIRMCPGNPHYFVSKGFALEKMGQKTEAEAAYQQAVTIDVNHYRGWRKAWATYGQALAYGRLGDKENCLKTLKISIGLLPRLKDRAKREELLQEYWNDPDFKALVE
ncbi:MAG: hypothetical protein AMS15_08760, partial [Planctomycetes bacterium DG_23]